MEKRATMKLNLVILSLTVLCSLPLFSLEAQAPRNNTQPQRVSKTWYGMASWYGDEWAGRRTACGQKFDPDRLTAAHPYLSCGTWVRVTNVRTQHSSFARITDRGPYQDGREMDVSKAVAQRIDLQKYGVEKVKIEIVRRADDKR